MARANRQRSRNPALPFGSGDALLRNFVENAAIPTFVADPDGIVVYANRAFAELLGYEPHELAGLSLGDIIHPDEVPSARAQALELAARKTTATAPSGGICARTARRSGWSPRRRR